MIPIPEYEHYDGWAECFHLDGVTNEETGERERAWIAEATKGAHRMPDVDLTETLIYEIGTWASVTIAVDQWACVTAEGSLTRDGGHLFLTTIQGDSVLLALAETFRVWSERAALG